MDQGVARLETACRAALGRLRTVEDTGIAPDIFAELGETLFWLCALAEATGHKKDRPIMGLRWARDRVAHGVLLAAPVEWQYGSELGRLVLGRSTLGTRSQYRWLQRSAVHLGPTNQHHEPLERSYDELLAGTAVSDVIERALDDLTAIHGER